MGGGQDTQGERGMMGHDGMMGGMMMGEGMGGSGMGCQHMGQMADVQVEQTQDGAILRLTTKDPSKVAQVQQHAQMMANCMGGGTEGKRQPAAKPRRQ
ncbi:hypothetical protein JQX13_52610 [Archangium violaceum]|uniref:hypothetical protein n=1 Tax=Archangium violaceum TaxID=83451 RepID=UPI00193C1553|nr:hypothetical protein [Archangium violaceum]QRK14249.1 hypothetical protein JQX13_52610 [Archangium violaceum]